MDIKIIYEDKDVLAADKPAGMVVFPEASPLAHRDEPIKTLIGELIKKRPELERAGEAPRYGIVHRLDKDTSGILLVAKSSESLIFLQKKFINREADKKYICLVEGDIKQDFGTIKTFIVRSKKDFRKQVAVFSLPAGRQAKSAREAITEYKVLERYADYTLLEVKIKTGRRHQIRSHLSYLQHPIAGDKLYGFKNSKVPEGLERQFLHSAYLKIQLLSGEIKEFKSDLPEDLKKVLEKLEK